MIDLKILEELSNAFGPSGFEEDVVRVIKNIVVEWPFEMMRCIMYTQS